MTEGSVQCNSQFLQNTLLTKKKMFIVKNIYDGKKVEYGPSVTVAGDMH